MFTLWRFMILLCFTTSLAFAIGTARGSGAVAYVLAAVVGAIVGGVASWAMRTLGKVVRAKTAGGSQESGSWLIAAIYFAGALWVIATGIAAKWLTLEVVHHV